MRYLIICLCSFLLPARSMAQNRLDKMPADLETALALSALPADLQAGATVYLLDPAKGYYVGRPGSNGFICFISRTEWEWAEFRKDLFAPISYDAEGARTIFPLYRDAAAMRASGKFTALQIRDIMIGRIKKRIYVAPARTGISYMLAPIMRVYTGSADDKTVMTMSMPHYMVYAPYVRNSDLGINPNSPEGPWLVNPGNTVLGQGKGPYGYIIMPAREKEAAKIVANNKGLLKRLADYSPFLKVEAGGM